MSRAPERWLKTSDAGRVLRALSASTPPYDVDAGLARLTAAIGAATVVGAASASASAAAASAGGAAKTAVPAVLGSKATVAAAKITLGMKLVVSSVVIVGVGTATVLVGDHADDAPAASGHRTVAQVASGPTERRSQPSPPQAQPTISPSLSSPPPPPLSLSPSPPPPPPPSLSPPPSALRPEMEHLASLRQTFDPALALARAEEGHAKFPRGVFWQDREAIAITSLVRLGRADEARTRARAFIAKHPQSPGVEELRRLLGE